MGVFVDDLDLSVRQFSGAWRVMCNPAPGRIIEAHDMNTGDSVIDRLGARYHRKGGAGRVAFFVSPRADSADLAADFTAAATVGSSSHVVFRCDYAPAAGPMARRSTSRAVIGSR